VTAGEELASSWFCLPRDHGVRFPDRAAFVTGSFQAFVGDFGANCGASLYWEADARPDFYLPVASDL
jgi:hypothetical protein